MKNRYRYGNLLGYVDLSMNLLMCFIIMFAFAFMLMRINDIKNATIDFHQKAKLIIHLHWPDESNTDLDLWVKTDNPFGIVSFRQTDSGNMWLDHDSLGAKSNQVKMSDGTIKQAFGNDEVVQIKECTKTRVYINVHIYRPEPGEFPLTAFVEMMKGDTFAKLASRSFTMSGEKGQEVTAFSFDLNENCDVTNIDEKTFYSFVYKNTGYEQMYNTNPVPTPSPTSTPSPVPSPTSTPSPVPSPTSTPSPVPSPTPGTP